MLYFKRTINDTTLKLHIDKNLYLKNVGLFETLLSTYKKTFLDTKNESTDNDIALEIVSGNTFKKCIDKAPYRIFCNAIDKHFAFQLIGALEDWYANILNCTIIHGSCVRLNNKNILLIGERKSGKTTLTSYLSLVLHAEYIDDDCVYISKSKYIGFNMPISVRENVDQLMESNMVGETFDGETMRTIYYPPKTSPSVHNIDVVILPKYNNENDFVRKLDKSEAFKTIINNVRHSKDMCTLFQDINNLLKNTKVYEVAYRNTNNFIAITNFLFYQGMTESENNN